MRGMRKLDKKREKFERETGGKQRERKRGRKKEAREGRKGKSKSTANDHRHYSCTESKRRRWISVFFGKNVL